MDQEPIKGEAWEVLTPAGTVDAAVCLGGQVWNMLVVRDGEPDLDQFCALTPVRRLDVQPAGYGWAEHFDALAAYKGLNTTWSQLVASCRREAMESAGLIREQDEQGPGQRRTA